MRIRFDGPAPAQPEMYFRGPVLSRFDGYEWRPLGLPFAPPTQPERPPTLRTSGKPLSYEATIEPIRVAAVPLLEATTEIGAIDGYRVVARDDLQWLADKPILERLRFKATASTRFVLGAPRRFGELQEDLELPPGFNPRTIAWAHAFRDDRSRRGVTATRLAQDVLQHVASQGYSYTLSPGDYGPDGVDEFWLDRKEGFCEHFAAAFVVIMRAAGVPARIVTGYQGNGHGAGRRLLHRPAELGARLGRVLADRNGLGTRRPDRRRRSRSHRPERPARPPAGFVAGTLDAMNPQILAKLRGAWEAVNNRWNQWVLNYSRGQQFDVMKQIGFASPTWEDLAILLVGALSGLALAGAVWAWLDRHRVDPWVRQLDEMKRALRPLGVAAAPHDPPRALAARVRERLGGLGEPLAALLDAFEARRYGRSAARRPDPTMTRDFTRQARRLRAGIA
jgi:transglutaminase-like putative cysteine protease